MHLAVGFLGEAHLVFCAPWCPSIVESAPVGLPSRMPRDLSMKSSVPLMQSASMRLSSIRPL
jgi:hypothetical protein